MGALAQPTSRQLSSFLLSMSSKGTVTIRPRKFLTNRLLERRQMILDVHHPNLATPDKETLKGMLAEYLSKAKGQKASKEATVIFGMKPEPKHRLIQSGHIEKAAVNVGRKQRKEKKNREKKFRGTRKEKRVRVAKN